MLLPSLYAQMPTVIEVDKNSTDYIFACHDKNFYPIVIDDKCQIKNPIVNWSLRLHLIQWFKDRRVLLILLAVGLFLAEAFFSLWTGNTYDMNIWYQTGLWMNRGVNIYVPDNHIGYPPLWALWCLVSYNVSAFFGNNILLWRFTIKLPIIIGQFALAFVVWKFVQKRFVTKTAEKTLLFTLTCTFFIYIGALWGQINILSALLTFLAFYAVTNKRAGVGGVLLGLAVALKIYPLVTLPAFLAFAWKNQDRREVSKFVLYTFAVPVLFTLGIFAAYGWDLFYFLKTIFYWAPVYDANPLQFQGGCMNIWSFLGLFGVDISRIWILRFIWIPILGAATVYWFRKRKMGTGDLNLALISFYVLFMISYSWVSEQTFLDPLPFIFLQILAFKPKRFSLYALAGIQVLVYAFSLFNGGPLIFEPLFARFYPALIGPAQNLSTVNSNLAWTIRGSLGLIISLSLTLFLLFLAEPLMLKKAQEKAKKIITRPFMKG
jgi:hypothetical protein